MRFLVGILVFVGMFSCTGFKPVRPSEYGNLVCYQNDLKIEYQAYMLEGKTISLDEKKMYYWSKNHEIFFTQGNYSGRLLHGKYSMYYKEGNLKEKGVFKMGLKNGEWYEYKKDGTIDKIIKWDEGKKIGVTFDSSIDKMNVKYLSKKEKRIIRKTENEKIKLEKLELKNQNKLDKIAQKEAKAKEKELKKQQKTKSELKSEGEQKKFDIKSIFKKDKPTNDVNLKKNETKNKENKKGEEPKKKEEKVKNEKNLKSKEKQIPQEKTK